MRRTELTHDPRRPPRFDMRAPVDYCGCEVSGRGLIWNISVSGARIEATSAVLPPGTEIELRASFYDGSRDVLLAGRVVRQTPKGFAVRFENLETDAQRMLRTLLPQAL